MRGMHEQVYEQVRGPQQSATFFTRTKTVLSLGLLGCLQRPRSQCCPILNVWDDSFNSMNSDRWQTAPPKI